jgi:hypothetical protein
MAKRKLTLEQVWGAFCALHFNDQHEFVNRLPWPMLISHPMARIEENGEEMERQRKQIEADERVQAEKAKQIRNPGKRDRNALILKALKTNTQQQVAMDFGVSLGAVQQVVFREKQRQAQKRK